MRSLSNHRMWSHQSIKTGKRHSNREIRTADYHKVSRFRDLVPVVARMANHNPDYGLFFRGQRRDHRLKSGASSFYPTIYRHAGRRLSAEELERRFRTLQACSRALIGELSSNEIEEIGRLRKFPELQWSILQHYSVCGTPLIDLTQSLRVAASFALNGAKEYGYVFVFALPHPLGTITYSTEDELLNVRLLSASPASALRPLFQEGFLVGSFPTEERRKGSALDLGRRLIGKLKIPVEGFWDDDFHAIPDQALYPDLDSLLTICDRIKVSAPGSS